MKQSIFIALLLCANLLAAQSSQFSISGKAVYSPKKSTTYHDNFDGFSLTPINDSLSQKTNFTTKFRSTETFVPKLGYELIGNVRFKLRPRFNLKTGFGLNYTLFNLKRSFNQSSYTELGTEIITTPIYSSSSDGCDIFKNTPDDIQGLRDGTDFNILSLKIPVELEYEVIPNKLNFGLGMFVQSPLFSTVRYEYRDYLIEENENGESLNNLQLGILWNMTYLLTDNVAAQVGITREFNDVFIDYNNTQHRSTPYEYNPLKIHVGIEYSFGGKRKK